MIADRAVTGTARGRLFHVCDKIKRLSRGALKETVAIVCTFRLDSSLIRSARLAVRLVSRAINLAPRAARRTIALFRQCQCDIDES